MEIKPIAFFRSPFKSKFGIPRQSGIVENLQGTIEFLPEYAQAEATRGLDGFSFLWLIWGFSGNRSQQEFHATVRPPRLGGNERLGVFATRSPYRPNALGLSSVRIVSVGSGKIVVGGADLMDGTPIYDVKPYLPYADAHPEALGGFTSVGRWHKLRVRAAIDMSPFFTPPEQEQLLAVLAQDPRPHYQNDPEREYGMEFMSHDVRFRVIGEELIITEIK